MKKIIKNPKYLILFLSTVAIIVKFIFYEDNSKKNISTTIEKNKIQKSLNIVSSEPISESINEFEYILKEFNGKLAVFKKNKTEPEIIFDVIIDSLPEFDIIQLKQGLKIKNEQELNERIEDFIS